MEKKTLKGIIRPGIILLFKEPPELIPSHFSPVITHSSSLWPPQPVELPSII